LHQMCGLPFGRRCNIADLFDAALGGAYLPAGKLLRIEG
jgi:hypothetical protein